MAVSTLQIINKQAEEKQEEQERYGKTFCNFFAHVITPTDYLNAQIYVTNCY
jgi:hypothetical protein